MSKPILFELPGELQNSILLQHCDGIDRLVLRNTCRRLREIVPTPTTSELVQAEEDHPVASRKDLYTCSVCATLRHRSKFADDMVEGKTGKEGADASSRFCLHCGLHVEYTGFDGFEGRMVSECRYGPGEKVGVGGVWHVVCIGCREFAKATHEMAPLPVSSIPRSLMTNRAYEPFCEGCRGRFQRPEDALVNVRDGVRSLARLRLPEGLAGLARRYHGMDDLLREYM